MMGRAVASSRLDGADAESAANRFRCSCCRAKDLTRQHNPRKELHASKSHFRREPRSTRVFADAEAMDRLTTLANRAVAHNKQAARSRVGKIQVSCPSVKTKEDGSAVVGTRRSLRPTRVLLRFQVCHMVVEFLFLQRVMLGFVLGARVTGI